MDKLLHFALSFVLSASLNAFMPKKNANVLSISVCVGKEVWDYHNPPHCAEWMDLLAGVGGVCAADVVISRIEKKTLLSSSQLQIDFTDSETSAQP